MERSNFRRNIVEVFLPANTVPGIGPCVRATKWCTCLLRMVRQAESMKISLAGSLRPTEKCGAGRWELPLLKMVLYWSAMMARTQSGESVMRANKRVTLRAIEQTGTGRSWHPGRVFFLAVFLLGGCT